MSSLLKWIPAVTMGTQVTEALEPSDRNDSVCLLMLSVQFIFLMLASQSENGGGAACWHGQSLFINDGIYFC